MSTFWQTSRRSIDYGAKALVMGILNATPDSFSDGGLAYSVDDALRRAEQIVSEGADIIDVGGESTRPGSRPISADEESARVIPVIRAIAKRFDIPVSVDTWKAETARRAVDAGAEIINDISGLRWEPELARVAAENEAGLVLMHLRGSFETMHQQEPAEDIFAEVISGFYASLSAAEVHSVRPEKIVLDVGIGFSKSQKQNLELIAKLPRLVTEFPQYPLLVGASRKSFIGKLLDGALAGERLAGSVASAAVAIWNGAAIVRVHDVKQTHDAVRVVEALMDGRN